MSNEAGTVIERTNYDPYGGPIGKVVDGIGYTGHVMDGLTGLTNMQQRYYDQGVGRFLSVDPVSASSINGGNLNRYWYANNNPHKFVDPDGRSSICRTRGKSCKVIKVSDDEPQRGDSENHGKPLIIDVARNYNAGQGGGGGLIPRDTIDAKVRDAIARGEWDEAISYVELTGGQLSPGTARLLSSVRTLREAGYTRNTISHVFKQKHELDALVRTTGSQEAAMVQIHNAAQVLATSAANGSIIPSAIVRIGTQSIWVQGRVMDGVFRVSSASMRVP
jgi:RHS repeat-associated protein